MRRLQRASGTLGDFVAFLGQGDADLAPGLMSESGWPPLPGLGGEVSTASPGPGLRVWWRGDVQVLCAARGGLGLCLAPSTGQPADEDSPLMRQLQSWHDAGRPVEPRELRGRFSVVSWDTSQGSLHACTDAFRTCNLVWAATVRGIWLASDLRLLLRAGALAGVASRRALYHYLNFSFVPSPTTALEGAFKLPGGHCLQVNAGQVSSTPWWDAHYPEDFSASEAQRTAELRERLERTVSSYAGATGTSWGAFLSGGTDSSSICSILSRSSSGDRVRSFSIGFEEQGYDELGYARLASNSFGLQAYEHRLAEGEAVDAIGKLALAYDEPFGNASAIPTHRCAQLAAHQGVHHLVAGDGGDEIFGGNERYRKDAIFEAFHRAPASARWLAHGLAQVLRHADGRWPNRVKNFVHRGNLPNPDRFYSDDAFASEHFESLLCPAFREGQGVEDSLDVLRRLHGQCDAEHELHRLMYLDLKLAIADNDVVKVVRASRLAGVDISFPYLDRDLVDFTGRLPVTDKLRGRHKRYLFKKATRDLLPEAIRNKRKQGFGLPIAVWLRRRGRYRELVHDLVMSSRAATRNIVHAGFVKQLIERHDQNSWDHSAEVHQLLMLELWHRQVVDGHG